MVSLRQPSTLPVVGVVADGQTYRNLLYLLLAIPLGFAYSALFTIGLVFGLLLSVVLVGLVILLAIPLGTRLIAVFERWLANRLLGTDIVTYGDVPDDVGGGLASVGKYTDAASTWRGVGFVSLKFFITLLAFIPVFGLANALPLVTAPLRYPYTASFGEVNGEPVTWAITTLPEALIALPIGVVGLIVVFHVSNVIAYVARQMAIALLGESAESDPTATEPADPESMVPQPTEPESAAAAEPVTVGDDSSEDTVSTDEFATDSESDAADNDSESTLPQDDAFEYAAVDDEDDSETPDRDGETPDRDTDR